MIQQLLLAGIMLTTITAEATTTKLTLSDRGQRIADLSAEKYRQSQPAKEITVWEPHEEREVTYVGFEVAPMFDRIYGPKWRKGEEVLFTCVDGYQPSLPVQRFLDHKAFLVFQRKGQAFQVKDNHKNSTTIDLGPYYLVWDNLHSKDLRATGSHGWPYQVAAIDLVRFDERFPRMSPPKDASKKVQRGFLAYRHHCMSCHSINGEGGEKAPELNYPKNVTEYFDDPFLRQWIKNPTSVRYRATMPAFSFLEDKTLDEILSYLSSMKDRKIKPKGLEVGASGKPTL